MSAERCASCTCYSSETPEYDWGFCRRSPPVVAADGATYWPAVNGKRDWCAQHARRLTPTQKALLDGQHKGGR